MATAMTPQQAEAGLVELVLPNGGHVLVDFAVEASINPALEASVVQLMLDATGNEEDVVAMVTDYAEASGFTAALSVDNGYRLVRIG
jgi:hypothetical protein